MSHLRLFQCASGSLITLALIAGCASGGSGGSGGGGSTTGAPPISVAISPLNPAALVSGATQTFTATVANDATGAGVTWTASAGSITTSGLYTAPTPVVTETAVVTATSKADATKSASVSVPLTSTTSNPISLNPISPATIALGIGGSQSFADSVVNDSSNSGVSWSIGSGPGSLTASSTTGVTYNAPTSPVSATTTVTLTAASIKDPTKSTTATITLNPISVGVNPTNAVMTGGATQGFAAGIANDGTNAGVTWTVTGGGSFSAGTTLSGAPTVYTAASPVTGATAIITATSKADPTKSGSVTVTLTPISLNPISPATATVGTSGSQAFTDSVNNDGSNSGVSWSITSGPGTLTASSTTGVTYNAPTTVIGSQTTATLTATSIKDPSQSTSATITVTPIAISLTSPASIVLDGNGTQAFTIVASITGDGSASGATFVVGGAGGTMSASPVTGNSPSSIYTAPVVSTATASTITVASVKDPTKTRSVAVTLNPPMTFTTTPGALAGASTGTAYPSTPIVVAGGSGTKTFTISAGSLPAGLAMSTSGVITGTPTGTAGTSNFTVHVADQSSTPASINGAFSITVGGASITWVTPTAGTQTYTVGTPITPIALSATGGTGAITYSVNSGSLPQGLQIVGNQVTGTPTAPTVGAGNIVTFLATDSATPTPATAVSPSVTFIVESVLTITTPNSLPTATPNTAYNQSLAASGGTGSGYTWTVTSGATGANSLASLNLSVSSAGVVSGTPTTTGTANFTIQVKDSSNNTVSASLSVSTSATLALPAPNPSSLGTAGITLSYIGAVNATGGIAGYTWTVNGTSVPTNGSSLGLTDSLSVSNSGGSASLSVGGTPTATGSVSFTASVKDSTGAVAGPFTYTIAVSNVYTVGGSINARVGCGSASLTGVTVSINTNPVQTTTTGANGSFSFINVPNGTYTITPSLANAIFSPVTESVTVNNNNLSATSFTANLSYSVSGTVAYTGAQTGQIYLAMNPNGTCGGGTTGTSISSTGAFTIRGVPPGSYTLQAFMDDQGNGIPNASNPVGDTSNVSVSTANLTGVSVTLGDPATVMLTTAPTLKSVTGINNGAIAQYTPITNSSGVEMATYYTFQWSISPTFATIAGSKKFPANGTHINLWFLNRLTNGSVYYFRTYGTSPGTNVGPYSQVIGPVTIASPTVGNIVTGSVSFAAADLGPLYVGFYNQGTGAFYGQYFAAPVSAEPYTIQVPTGSDYLFVALVDQNNDGVVDANDITNISNGSSNPITTISGDLPNENLTLPSADGIATVTTQDYQTIVSGNTSQSYNLSFQVSGLIKQPTAITLVSGPNLITPVDVAICGGTGSNCGQGFQITFNLNSTSPGVGDTYTFSVTYSDGTTGTLTAAVTAVLSAFPFNLAPQTGAGAGTTPTFTWTDPANASNYSYQFFMNDSNGNPIWQLPGSNATNSSGFSSAITSITWGTDPTGGGSNPLVGSLTQGTTYLWQITVLDSNGNAAVTQVQYQP